MLRRSDGLVQLQAGSAGQDWILARRFCAYTLLDASSIPSPRRKAYAAIAVQRWSPFADSRFQFEWIGARAMVWAWSHTQVLALGAGESMRVPRRISPESLHRGEPHRDRACLVAMDEGIEGRIWRDQAMVASQWWPAAPTLEEWNVLRRGAGLSGEAVLPLTEMAPLLTVPWTRRQAEALNDLAARYRKSLLAFAVGLAVAVLATPLAASLRLLVKTAMLERVIQQQSVTVGATLKAREAAERDLGAVEQLLRLRPPQRQLRLLSVVVAKTPGTWKLLEWRMPDPRTLEVVMQMASPNPTALVRGWESSGVFSNVSVDIGRSGDVAIKAAIISVPGSGAGESALP